jgi:hypothetical protein
VQTNPRLNCLIEAVDGKVRQCMPILMAWIADLEEQWDLLGLAKNSCPKCLARTHDLGMPCTCDPRSGASILAQLAEIRACWPHADTWQFAQKAKEYGLFGVERLCWEGLPVDMCPLAKQWSHDKASQDSISLVKV